MPEAALSFQGLPAAYQQVIRLAEDQHSIAITPLQELSGGFSGARLFLVRVASTESDRLEHLILKLDRRRHTSSSDEVTRHEVVQRTSPPGFAQERVPQLALDRVESDEALAMFYAIAGQSLRRFRTLSTFRRQSRLERLFAATNAVLLGEWNAALRFEPMKHPGDLLAQWLGFRLDAGQKIEAFLEQVPAAG